MASKNRQKNNQPDHIAIKFVGKAKGGIPIGLWCKTTLTNGKFTQEWLEEKPE